MKVLGYTRVSREEQAAEGVSMRVQSEKVKLYAGLHDLDLIEVVEDPGASAKSIDRPGLSRVLAMLDSGQAEGVVVFKLDRLTRELGDWTHLINRYFGEKGGRSLMSVSESVDTRTAGGRMVLNIMMTIAMWERETIVERTRGAMANKKERSERVGQIPYGWALATDGRTLTVDPREQEGLGLIARMQGQGATLRSIAAELDRLGFEPKKGVKWSHISVSNIIKRPQAGAVA